MSTSSHGVGGVKQQAALACLLLARVSVGRAVCEMTGHANKLHHFCFCGRGQWATICRSGEMNGSHLCWHPEPPLPPPRPCWGLRGTEADTDRRAHPLPRGCAAVHHRIRTTQHYFVSLYTEIKKNKKEDEFVEGLGAIHHSMRLGRL